MSLKESWGKALGELCGGEGEMKMIQIQYSWMKFPKKTKMKKKERRKCTSVLRTLSKIKVKINFYILIKDHQQQTKI